MLKGEGIISDSLVVLFINSHYEIASRAAEEQVNMSLRSQKIEPWGSMEIEAYTYGKGWLIIAKPIKVYIPNLLWEFLDRT